ncbi:unnamed protein product [Trifolium pratense]|uniref:Uncharacterized protein n=1 Tax=Trifolium pratense TaxID=57577 RepID=A0ACB0LBF4_TRIPR|nr:unnamed protein product [Trifolium pratense]
MNKILKFVYTIILFVSLFLAIVKVGGKCIFDMHCAHILCNPEQHKVCILGKCYCINRVNNGAKNQEHARNDRRNFDVVLKVKTYDLEFFLCVISCYFFYNLDQQLDNLPLISIYHLW